MTEPTTDPRPARLGDVDIHDAVAAVRETEDLYRVYRREFLFKHRGSADDCAAHFEQNYQNRVRDEDYKIESDTALFVDDDQVGENYRLLIRLPNVKGEFKSEDRAKLFVAGVSWSAEAIIVARSSRAEQELLSYGKRRLA